MKATFIRQLQWVGDARHYRLDPPLEVKLDDGGATAIHEWVIVSSVVAMFTGPETLVFPATAEGDPLNFHELGFGGRGERSQEQVLREMGYEKVGP